MSESDFVECWIAACVHPKCIKSDTTRIGMAMWGMLHVDVGVLSLTMGSVDPRKAVEERSYWMQVHGEYVGGENARMSPENIARCVLAWKSEHGRLETKDQILQYLTRQ